ncbi:hypothetical protein [Chlamydia caviae]|uniref:Uncharacterized protein n=1 Tax=Chlamydia caviae (strain ATCC VR-813 / DSM 19441 / 03DC25 / GPIC) TaxID=227941 RepID=Q823S0_CHLCV|nr:hypothetical protein [Chlamydia caviae]AAP05084.1 hypothetical protein CCA_00336 [Chlamydia caviae GPIC]
MFLASIIIPAHTHLPPPPPGKDVEASPTLYVPKHLVNPNSRLSKFQKVVSCIPGIGLLVAAHLFHQKRALSQEYSKLEYSPNEECTNKTCASLDPKHLNAPLSIAVQGGLGLLFPFMLLVIVAAALIALVTSIQSLFCCTSPNQRA